VVHAVHAIAVFFKLMAPSLYHPSYRAHEMWSIVALNSFNLAMACRYPFLHPCILTVQNMLKFDLNLRLLWLPDARGRAL